MYSEIIIEHPVKSLDKPFTYEIPKNLIDVITVGSRVIVPFGQQILNGIVLNINSDCDKEVKQIYRVSNEPSLTKEQIEIGKFLKSKTLCTLICAYQTMLPPSLKIKNNNHNYEKYDVYLNINPDSNIVEKYIINHPRALKKIEIIERLKKEKILKREINSSVFKELLLANVIKEEKQIKRRINITNKLVNFFELNSEQQIAYDTVKNHLNEYNIYLLEGITGSGKTEVYMHIINDVIKNNKSVIVLVPEICLTTQTVERFYERFGNNVAVFHSGLSEGEKYDEYQKIYNDEVKIIVGTRSSIFAPIKNLGLIILDEEHSESYKQDNNPRYSTIDIATFRAKYNNIPLILASATPSLESKARADKGVYKHLTLTKRVNNNKLPKVEIVDMAKEINKRNFIFSDVLKDKIKLCLSKNEQIILLLNRRGYSTFISCSCCGYTYKCPNCDITLTYHKTSNNLRCHYCGYSIIKNELCPRCHSDSLSYLGLGTQKLEEELKKIFPSANIIRMDQDTTTKKGSYQRIIDDFSLHKYDILLGTQMISKGLDFKNVTLVGIINADTSLNIPDFRSGEKTFSLLYQTAGRCGRHTSNGSVIIQTFNPDNEILKYVKNNDYKNFYLYEMNIRHKLKYPPYVYLCLVKIVGKDYELVSYHANKIKYILDSKLDKDIIVFNPTPSIMFKVNNIYHFQITIKYIHDQKLLNVLKDIDDLYSINKDIDIEITFNPSRF